MKLSCLVLSSSLSTPENSVFKKHRFQIALLWRVFSNGSVFGDRFWRCSVDDSHIWSKTASFSFESGLVWMGPQYLKAFVQSTSRQKQLRNDAFHVKSSQCAKNQLDHTKNENRPEKVTYTLLAWKLSYMTKLAEKLYFLGPYMSRYSLYKRNYAMPRLLSTLTE